MWGFVVVTFGLGVVLIVPEGILEGTTNQVCPLSSPHNLLMNAYDLRLSTHLSCRDHPAFMARMTMPASDRPRLPDSNLPATRPRSAYN